MKITLDKHRRVLRIETDEFSIKLNGKANTVYRDMLAPMGIELRFEEGEPDFEELLLSERDTLGESTI